MSLEDPWFYIVLLGVVALVYALLLPRKSVDGLGAEANRNLEATLEQYMSEIERENEELITLVSEMKQDFTSKHLAQQEQIAELRQRLVEVEFIARQSESRLSNSVTSLMDMEQAAPISAASEQQEMLSAPAAPELQNPVPEPTGIALSSENDEPVQEHQEHVRDRYRELFDLFEQGKSIDMIAKSMGIQRGEVQLILQLSKREESQ